MNKALMHCAHDVELMYFNNIPLPKAIEYIKCLLAEMEEHKCD